MATDQLRTSADSQTVVAVAAMAVASFVGMGTAWFYSKSKLQAADEENKK